MSNSKVAPTHISAVRTVDAAYSQLETMVEKLTRAQLDLPHADRSRSTRAVRALEEAMAELAGITIVD